MIKRLLNIYLPAAVVLTTATLAGVFLYSTNDPKLEDVEFVIAKNAEKENTDRIAEDTEELRMTSDELTEDDSESDESVEAYHGASQSEVPNRDDVRTVANQTEPVIVTVSGPGVSIRCEVHSDKNKTAHQVMKQAADQCSFSYQTKQHASLGVFVDGLEGVTSDTSAGMYWIYSVNGVKANVGVSSYQIQPGDTITWNYEQEY